MHWFCITSDTGEVIYHQARDKEEVIAWLGRFEKLYRVDAVEERIHQTKGVYHEPFH